MWEGARAFSKHLSTGSPQVYFDVKDDFASNFTILFFELFCNLDHMRSVSFLLERDTHTTSGKII